MNLPKARWDSTLSPSGHLRLYWDERGAYVEDLLSGETITVVERPPIKNDEGEFPISAIGDDWIAYGHKAQEVTIINARTGETKNINARPFDDEDIFTLALHGDMLAIGTQDDGNGPTISVWDMRTNTRVLERRNYWGDVSVAIHGDRAVTLSEVYDDEVYVQVMHVFDLAASNQLRATRLGGMMSISMDDSHVVASGSHEVRVFELASGREVHRHSHADDTYWVPRVRMVGDFVVSAAESKEPEQRTEIKVFNKRSGELHTHRVPSLYTLHVPVTASWIAEHIDKENVREWVEMKCRAGEEVELLRDVATRLDDGLHGIEDCEDISRWWSNRQLVKGAVPPREGGGGGGGGGGGNYR